MNGKKAPSVPLILNDPYFSLWSPADRLYDTDTVHWSGVPRPIQGILEVDGKPFRFLGTRGPEAHLEQTNLNISPLTTTYTFQGAGICWEVTFTSPLLLPDLELVSRPCVYIDFAASSLDGQEHEVRASLWFDECHCHNGEEARPLHGGIHQLPDYSAAWMGQKHQTPLGHSGDGVTIDWGYFYLAVPSGGPGKAVQEVRDGRSGCGAELSFEKVRERQTAFIVAAYDDIASIQYFGSPRKAYWARNGKTILEALSESVEEHGTLMSRCRIFDRAVEQEAERTGGVDYADLCALSCRQSIAAHKLIQDSEGNAVFLSKECFSNGCIGTVDISYPSAPLYLMYAPELVKGMMRPVFRFAAMPVWEFDFAPHDVGRYPYADGQVYGSYLDYQEGDTPPPFYQYPKGSGAYGLRYQMPVEECGNMLILAAAVMKAEGNAEFAREHLGLLEKWACYLWENGGDPGEQLCTDDFAGHLAHNVNLSIKAVMGLASFGLILRKLDREAEGDAYLLQAKEMADSLRQRSENSGHSSLTFGGDNWSLKYNAVWDVLFETGLFPAEWLERETKWYIQMQNRCGVPLDSRADYTKSDWIAWAASMTEDLDIRAELLSPVATYTHETESRVPFSDWYDTRTGKQVGFQNRTVQGGMFMPLLKEMWRRKKTAMKDYNDRT